MKDINPKGLKLLVYHERFDLIGIVQVIQGVALVEQEDGNYMVYNVEWRIVGGISGV